MFFQQKVVFQKNDINRFCIAFKKNDPNTMMNTLNVKRKKKNQFSKEFSIINWEIVSEQRLKMLDMNAC